MRKNRAREFVETQILMLILKSKSGFSGKPVFMYNLYSLHIIRGSMVIVQGEPF
jgi:hypothetical protein